MNPINKLTQAIEVERLSRIEKAKSLILKKQNPYREIAKRDYYLTEVIDKFDSIEGSEVTLSGRIKNLRLSGKIGFTTMEDESCVDGFQFIFKQDLLDNKDLNFDDFKQLFDKGDYIEATGKLGKSQRGEKSLFVEEYKILTKALRSLPEKFEDTELKYRKRYIDMKLNTEVREMFRMKSVFWQSTRNFMLENGFLELQAPTMEHTTGGAEAEPFVTHHNALDEDFYLRISSELHLKRYIVGGFEKVFDIDKNFRNEGIDAEHLQEYIQMEFYWAYSSFDEMVSFTEDLIKYVINETFGTLILEKDGKKIDWGATWPKISYYDFVEKYANISLKDYDTIEKLQDLAKSLGLKYNNSDGYGRLVDLIYKKTARPKCIEPVWLIDHPVELSPLSKRNPLNKKLTLRSQLVAYGSELSNGFAELNDPIDQLERFEEQQSLRENGDNEAMMIDYDFVEALEYGMPPTCGFAYSERLFSMLMQKPIRETTAFPLMKRDMNLSNIKTSLKVAHIILYKDSSLEDWQLLNATAHLGASFAAREGKALFEMESSHTRDDIVLPMNIQWAILNKITDNQKNIRDLYKFCLDKKITVVPFTRSMLSSSNDKKVHNQHLQKEFQDVDLLGILIFGDKDIVENLTKNFDLI